MKNVPFRNDNQALDTRQAKKIVFVKKIENFIFLYLKHVKTAESNARGHV